MTQLIDMTGRKFGRLTVLRRAENASDGDVRWLCQCDCGVVKAVRGGHLRRRTQSCGCQSIETKSRRIGGLSQHKDYGRWRQMIRRCHNPDHKHYANYGGKGIAVCDRWRGSFSAFLEDMGEAPHGMTIDRIDNSKGYYPENCRWATWQEQMENKSTNHVFYFEGELRTITSIAREVSMDVSKLAYRVNVMGLGIKDAIAGRDYRNNRRRAA